MPASKDSGIVTVAAIRKPKGKRGAQILFNERHQIFTLPASKTRGLEAADILGDALKKKLPLFAVFDPKRGMIQKLSEPTQKALAGFQKARALLEEVAKAIKIDVGAIDPATFNVVDKFLKFPSFKTCKKIIPTYKKAQEVFDFCAAQSCNLAGPPSFPPCIPFQYVIDGCYARAHQMRKIITKKYHYCCEKVFSFANQNDDRLAVRADKWGGCCVTWWYHVAPLVRVRISLGPIKLVFAMVIDPGMFDQPVLLSGWLLAQQNTACSSHAKVSMYSIQDGSAYTPGNYQGTQFNTDPNYVLTNGTLAAYKTLKTCP